MRYAALLIFTVLTLAFACNKNVAGTATASSTPANVTKTIAPGGQENLAIGETLGIEKSSVTLKFVEVASDNRCPRGVSCIQAGEATVLVSLNGAAPQRMVMEAGNKTPVSLTTEDGVFRFTALTPYPENRVQITPEQRRLRVEFLAAKQMK